MGRQHFLDLARGLAALMVLVGHLRAFIFVDFGAVESASPLVAAFYALTSLGHQSVMVFFVLSGFLVGRSVHNSSSNGTWSWRRYATQRLVRLWIVLVPALLLTALLDHVGMALGNGAFYMGQYYNRFLSGPNGDADWSVAAFLSNLLFLQTISSPVFGSNGPLWSLANEFWYYLLFPLAYHSVRQGHGWWTRAVLAIMFVLLALWLPSGLVLYGVVWLIGFLTSLLAVALARLPIVIAVMHAVGPASLGLSILYSRLPHQPMSADFLVGLAFAIWIVPLSALKSAPRALGRAMAALADMSYSLYLTHFPFIALLTLSILRGEQLQPGPASWAIFVGLSAAALAWGALAYWLFERHTARIQRALVHRRPSSPADSHETEPGR